MKRKSMKAFKYILAISFAVFGACKASPQDQRKSTQVCKKPETTSALSITTDHCEIATNLKCDHRQFSPDVRDADFVSSGCAEINGQEFCVDVRTFSFNTAMQIEKAKQD